jgi:hypothetical protein
MNPVSSLASCARFSLGLLIALFPLMVRAQSTVTINFSTSSPTAVKDKITGYNDETFRTDHNMNVAAFRTFALDLNYGWARWFAGTINSSFDWQTASLDYDRIPILIDNARLFYQYGEFAKSFEAKGFFSLKEYYDYVSDKGLKFIITINAMTATDAEIDLLAKYCFDHGIVVDAWQLSNEPHLWQGNIGKGFYADATDYANKMKGYTDAIRNRIPGARVSVFYASDAGEDGTFDNWDSKMLTYEQNNSPRFWDAMSFHSYKGSTADITFSQKLASAYWNLSQINNDISYYLGKTANSNTPIHITELNTFIPQSSDWWFSHGNGIFLAEATMRYAANPNMELVSRTRMAPGMVQTDTNYIPFLMDVWEKYYQGPNASLVDINTLSYDFYYSAAGWNLRLVDYTLNRAAVRYTTTVTNSPTVATSDPGTSIPAVFAQTFLARDGESHLLVTNKGANAVNLAVTKNGAAITQSLGVNYVVETTLDGGGNPIPATNPRADVFNDETNHTLVQKLNYTISGGSSGLISLPAYTVMRITWTESGAAKTLGEARIYHREVGNNSLLLKWAPSVGADGYRVYSKLSSAGTYTQVYDGTNRTFTIGSPNVSNGNTYNYKVVPYYNGSGGTKVEGTVFTVGTIALTAPSAPTVVALYPSRNGRVIAKWESRVRATNYKAWMQKNGGTATEVPTTETSDVFVNIAPGDVIAFKVRASNGVGDSSYSSTSTLTYPSNPDIIPPPGVALLHGTVSSGSVALNWQDALVVADSWYFEKAGDASDWTVESGTFATGAHPNNSLPLSDTDVRNTTVYKSTNNSVICRARAGDVNWTNYWVQATIEVPAWPTNGKAWLFARYVDTNNWYKVGYNNTTGNIELRRKKSGTETLLGSFAISADPDLNVNLLNLSLRVNGNVISAYLDQNVIITHTDGGGTLISAGRIAIASDNVDTLFDKIEVKRSVMSSGSYDVYRSTSPFTGYSLRGNTSNTTFTDTGMGAGRYYYKIRGVKFDGATKLESYYYSNIRTVVVP